MIVVQDNLFPSELLDKTFNYFENYKDWEELPDSPQGEDLSTLGKPFEHDFEPIAKEFLQYLDRQEFRRCIYNCFRPGDCPQPHVDSSDWNGFTYMIYLSPNWNVTLGGETIFIDGEEIFRTVVPLYGRLVKFKSEIPHAARPPLRGKRYSLVFQTHPIGFETLGQIGFLGKD